MRSLFPVVAAIVAPTLLIAAPGLPEAQASRSRNLEAQGWAVQNQTVTCGRLTLHLQEGTLTPIQGGGLFFQGKALLRYRSEETLEAPVLAFNLEHNSLIKVKTEGGARIVEDTITACTLRLRNLPLPSRGTDPRPAPTEAFQAFLGPFDAQQGDPRSHREVLAALNAPTQPWAHLELKGEKASFRYDYDPVTRRREALTLLRFERRQNLDTIYEHAISSLPLGWTRKSPPDPHLAASRLKVELDLDAQGQGRLVATETLVPLNGGQQVLRLALPSYHSVADAAGGRTRIPVQLAAVKDMAGRDLPFDHAQGSLLVRLPAAAPAGEPQVLRFELTGPVAPHSFKETLLQVGSGHLPLAELNLAKVEATVTLPGTLAVLMVPAPTSRVEKDGKVILQGREDKPVGFALMAGPGLHLKEDLQASPALRLYDTQPISTTSAKVTKATRDLLKGFQAALGPFPWNQVIQSADQARNPQLTAFMARHLAERYWVAQPLTGSDRWMEGAFATYMAMLAVRDIQGKSYFEGAIQQWRATAQEVTDKAPLVLASQLAPGINDKVEHRYEGMLLGAKAPYLVHCMHRELGDKGFFQLYRAIQQKHGFQVMTTQDLAVLLQEVTKKDWQPFFDAYVWGLELPPAR